MFGKQQKKKKYYRQKKLWTTIKQFVELACSLGVVKRVFETANVYALYHNCVSWDECSDKLLSPGTIQLFLRYQ